MTRINAAIPPAKLCRQHLIAEHREIKRIPNVIKSGKFNMHGKPDTFTLGAGHVKFFYDKQLYLYNRYCQILEECQRRGYNMTDYREAWDGLQDTEHWNDWVETDEAAIIVTQRINDRLSMPPKFDKWFEHFDLKHEINYCRTCGVTQTPENIVHVCNYHDGYEISN